MVLALLLLPVFTARADFHFGLGKAAAKKSADVIEKSRNQPGLGNSSGGAGNWDTSSLASCGSGPLFTALPTALNELIAINPLGNLNPSGHTLPTKHLYMCGVTGSTATVVYPGNVRVTSLASSEYFATGMIDYQVYFAPCAEVGAYFFHISTLSAALQAQANAGFDSCTNNSTYRYCTKALNMDVSAGDFVGYVTYGLCYDFGLRDSRISSLGFVNTARYSTQSNGLDDLHVACGVDYFSPALKSSLENRLGLHDLSAKRTQAPLCGTTMHDVAATAQGNWFYPGGGSGEDPHLSLSPHNVFPTTGVFSVGNSAGASGLSSGAYPFHPTSSGLINRKFSQLTFDGNTYCYDTFFNVYTGAQFSNYVILVKLTDASTIKIEKQNSIASCGAGPWTMTSNATTFSR